MGKHKPRFTLDRLPELRAVLGAKDRPNIKIIARDFGMGDERLQQLIQEHDIVVSELAPRGTISAEGIEALRPILEAPGHPALSRLAIDEDLDYKTLLRALNRYGVNVHPETDRQAAPKATVGDDKLEEIAEILAKPGHPSIRAVAQQFGMQSGSLSGLIHRLGIFVHPITERADFYTWTPAPPPKPAPVAAPSTVVRYTSPMARKPKPSSRLFGPLGKPKQLKPTDRAEMDRLIAEAVAAGKVTRCPPAYARGCNPSAWYETLGKAS